MYESEVTRRSAWSSDQIDHESWGEEVEAAEGEAKPKGKMGVAKNMLRMVLQDGGDEKVLERVRALFTRMTDIEKTEFVQMLVKSVTGNDLADATLKQSIRQGAK